MIFLLLAITATFSPSSPTVGDPITIQFGQPVTLDASEVYEVVRQDGGTVVVRTFRPEPFEISGVVGNTRFRKLTIPVMSVLDSEDDLKPAPLKAPAKPAAPQRPWIAIGSAAAVAALAWLAAMLLARRAAAPTRATPAVDPAEQFRRTVDLLRNARQQPGRWADLADATRRYLAATYPELGLELTTSEFLAKAPQPGIETILRQGDLEKFSPWGAGAGDFDRVAQTALELIPVPVGEEKAA